MRATLRLPAALLLTTLAVLIPSLPFRLGLFEFYTLSWFHLYIAAGSAIAALAHGALCAESAQFRGARRHRARAAAAAGAADPRRARVPRAARSRAWTPSSRCVRWRHGRHRRRAQESHARCTRCWSGCVPVTRSVLRMARMAGACDAARVLLDLLHVRAGAAVRRSCACITSARSRCTCRGWSWPQCRRTAGRQHRKLIALPSLRSFAACVLDAGALPVRGPTWRSRATRTFRALRPILEDLQQACAKDPGIVLADNDAGHYIRYYTQCSVIANNFLLTRATRTKDPAARPSESLPARIAGRRTVRALYPRAAAHHQLRQQE